MKALRDARQHRYLIRSTIRAAGLEHRCRASWSSVAVDKPDGTTIKVRVSRMIAEEAIVQRINWLAQQTGDQS